MSRALNAPPPSPVPWLGYGGLIPFAVLAALTVGGPYRAAATRGLLGYGAVILSFVGAVNWGVAMMRAGLDEPRRRLLWLWSVVPALIGWAALFLAPLAAGALMVGGFLVQYAVDRRLSRDSIVPPWYLPLRLRLTVGACVCLSVGAMSASGAACP